MGEERMIELIKKYLLKLVDDIDAGNSNISDSEAIELVDILKRLTDKEKRMSKYAACRYLNMSRVTFDNYVRTGKLPKGKHEIGFKELSYSKKDLDEFIMGDVEIGGGLIKLNVPMTLKVDVKYGNTLI